jgi:predicted nucleic acid-binding Zn ribbon protein
LRLKMVLLHMAKSQNEEGNTQHIGQAIQQLLNRYHLKAKFDEANLLASWERLAGKPVAKRTKKLYIRGKVLFVELESPSMKNDLNLHKSQIIEILQKEFGKDVVKEIVIM